MAEGKVYKEREQGVGGGGRGKKKKGEKETERGKMSPECHYESRVKGENMRNPL